MSNPNLAPDQPNPAQQLAALFAHLNAEEVALLLKLAESKKAALAAEDAKSAAAVVTASSAAKDKLITKKRKRSESLGKQRVVLRELVNDTAFYADLGELILDLEFLPICVNIRNRDHKRCEYFHSNVIPEIYFIDDLTIELRFCSFHIKKYANQELDPNAQRDVLTKCLRAQRARLAAAQPQPAPAQPAACPTPAPPAPPATPALVKPEPESDSELITDPMDDDDSGSISGSEPTTEVAPQPKRGVVASIFQPLFD